MTRMNKVKQKTSRDKILTAAIDLFATKGFAATAISDVVKSVDISASSIYHYFGSKEDLMVAVLDTISTQYLQELSAVIQEEMLPLDRFRFLIEKHVCLIIKHWRSAKITNIDQENISREGKELDIKNQRQVLDIYLRELKTLNDLGYLHAFDLSVLAFSILGTIMWVVRWYRPEGKLSLEEISKQIASFVLNGALNDKGKAVET